jgi:hypothetical protein
MNELSAELHDKIKQIQDTINLGKCLSENDLATLLIASLIEEQG